MDVCVACHAGYRGEESPRVLHLGDREVQVLEVLRAWREPGCRMFVVLGQDQERYTLRHDEQSQAWELTAQAGSGQRP